MIRFLWKDKIFFGKFVRTGSNVFKNVLPGDRMSLLEEKNRLAVENTTLRRQMEEVGNRINPYIPHLSNGEQV